MAEPVIIAAVGTSASSGTRGLGRLIEVAKQQAIVDAWAEVDRIMKDESIPLEERKARADAIRDPQEMLRRQLAARDAVKEQFAKAEAEAKAKADADAAGKPN